MDLSSVSHRHGLACLIEDESSKGSSLSSSTTKRMEIQVEPVEDLPEKERDSSHGSGKTPPRWRKYIAIIAGACQQALCWGLIMTFGTILSFYSEHLLPDTSKVKLALVGAIPPFMVLAMSPFMGRCLDAGLHRWLNGIGGFLITAAIFALGFTGGDGSRGAGTYWHILLSTFPLGIGQSFYFISSAQVGRSWLPENGGFAMGLTSSGATIGGVIFPLIIKEIFIARWGFKKGVMALSGIVGCIAVFIGLFSTPNPAMKKRKVGKVAALETWWNKSAFENRAYLFQVAAMCAMFLGFLSVPFFLEVWAYQRDFGAQEINGSAYGVRPGFGGKRESFLLCIFNASQLWGRISGPLMGDAIGQRKVFLIMLILATVAISISWPLATEYWHAALFCCVAGPFYGAVITAPTACVSELLGKRNNLLGSYAGMAYLLASPFVLLGPIMTGLLVENWHINALVPWVAGCFLTAAVCLFLSMRALESQKRDHRGGMERDTIEDEWEGGRCGV